MTELKTLKDLKVDDKLVPSQAWRVMEEQLKAEAVKRVKKFDEDIAYWKRVGVERAEAKREVFIDFFNLTEEDLK